MHLDGGSTFENRPMEGKGMPNWYLIYTKPRSENAVTDKLQGCGFEVLNPKLRERRFIRRKTREMVSPLFPCYVFAKFSVPENYRLIRYTRGVRKVVGSELRPIPVHEDIIESIRTRMEDDGVVRVELKKFHAGDAVEIKGGPFAGLEAIFLKELGGMERVSILLREVNARIVVDGAVLDRL